MRSLLLFLAFVSPMARGDILRVGPEEAFKSIGAAARAARDGDLVEILPGTYARDVAVWRQANITIIGLGEGPVLESHGNVADGKAIWVFEHEGGRFHVANITFRGARARDGNGAGIRLTRGTLSVEHCTFEDNQNGILTSNFDTVELSIKNSVFSDAPKQFEPPPHLLYVGAIGKLELTGSRFHKGYAGHLVKSRARETRIAYNLLSDGPEGEASYEVDLPNGGDALLIGNLVGQSAHSQNPVVVAYGAEGFRWPVNRLRMAHNTLLSERLPGAWFLRIWDNPGKPSSLEAINNLTVGIGAFTLINSGTFSGNVPALESLLAAPDVLDYSLPADSLLNATLSSAAEFDPVLEPRNQFAFPVGTSPLPPREKWTPGAFQSSPYAR